MNISQKCNCCLKESVCKFTAEYNSDCNYLKNNIHGRTTYISIKCKEFVAHQTNIREVQNER